MRSSNLNQEQADDGKTFVSNMNNVYQQMGAQDRKEAAIVGKSKQSKTGFFGFSKKGGPVARPMKQSKMDDSFSANLFQAQKMTSVKMQSQVSSQQYSLPPQPQQQQFQQFSQLQQQPQQLSQLQQQPQQL